MKRRLLLVGFSLLLLVPLLASLLQPKSVNAASSYIYHDNSNEFNITITGPDIPNSPKQATFKWNSKGEYVFEDGNSSDPSNDCFYYLRTSNGQDKDTKATITPSGGVCGSINGKNFPITITIPSGPTGPVPQSGTWVNHSTITSGGITYKDPKIDDTLGFSAINVQGCAGKNYIDSWPNNIGNDTLHLATATATIHLFTGADTNNCAEQDSPINFKNPIDPETGSDAYDIYFWWQDAGTISSTDDANNTASIIFVQTNGTGPYYGTEGRVGNNSTPPDCYSSSFTASVPGEPKSTLILRNDNLNDGWPNDIFNAGRNLQNNGACQIAKGLREVIGGGKENGHKPAGSSALATNNANSGSITADSCGAHSGALGWAFCPVIQLLDSATQGLDSAIQAQLKTPDPESLGTHGQTDKLKQAWGRIRDIALIILVPLMLIMVISTALNFSFVDAYTVRRTMPRFLIAVLFISVSWYITRFLVVFTNSLGQGILGLITQPFGVANKTLADFIKVSNSTTTTGLGLLVFGGLILAGSISFGIVISVALITAAILFIGFLLLTVREILIFALLLLAPLAILCWIFPGTKKGWDFWWDSFFKLLLMYPFILILIGSGKIFASVITDTRGTSWESQVLVIFAYIIPYALIPLTFRFAGGLFSTLSGMANDRSRGFFDKQREKRTQQRKELHEFASQNRRFNPTGKLRGLNRLAGGVADPMNTARIALGTPRGRALATELTQKSAMQGQDLAKWMSQAGFNQEALTEIMGISAKNKGRVTRAGLDESIAHLRAKGGTQNLAGANQLQSSASFLEETWRTEEFGRAHIGYAAGLAKAQQGFLTSDDDNEIANYTNLLNDTAPGLGDTFKTQAGLINAQAGGLSKVGYSEQVDAATGRTIAGGVAARSIQLSRTSVQELAGAKSAQIERHFLKNGALDAILNADTSSDATATITDAVSGQKLRVTDARKTATLDAWAQAAYGYNTPAETAEVLRTKLDSLIGPKDADGRATTDSGKRVEAALVRATRDPSRFGGLDVPPPPPAE